MFHSGSLLCCAGALFGTAGVGDGIGLLAGVAMERQAVAANVVGSNGLFTTAGGVERQVSNTVILCCTVVYCVIHLGPAVNRRLPCLHGLRRPPKA